MPKLTIYHQCDIYEVVYTPTSITHIDKLMGESQTRREIVFERLPLVVQTEVLTTIHLEEEEE